MDYSDFSSVHVLRPKSSEEVYLMSTGNAPSTLIILSNGLSTNNFMAYKAVVTAEIIQDWNRDAANVELSPSLFMEEVHKALIGADSFTFDLSYSRSRPLKVMLMNLMDPKVPKTILEVDLVEIPASEGLIALSRTGMNSLKVTKLSDATTAEIEGLRKENKRLQNVLEDLTVAKNKWEDSHYRAFAKILNAKKRRICELKGVPHQKQKVSKKGRALEDDSDEEEMNTSDENDSSEDYNRETDVDESPDIVTKEDDEVEGNSPEAAAPAQSTTSKPSPFKKMLALDDDSDDDAVASVPETRKAPPPSQVTLIEDEILPKKPSPVTGSTRNKMTFQNYLALDDSDDTGSETEFKEDQNESPIPSPSTSTATLQQPQKINSAGDRGEHGGEIDSGRGHLPTPAAKTSASSETGDEFNAEDFDF